LDHAGRIAPRNFLLLAATALIVSRAVIIVATPAQNNNIDLSIYREAGQLVLAGVDPYAFQAQPNLGEKFRTDGRGAVRWVAEDVNRYNYYVSSNLPGSTLLYAAVERLSRGSPLGWRIAFMLGDLLMLLSAYFFFMRSEAPFNEPLPRLAFVALFLAYPSLLIWGTVLPEDKQFQTALLLMLAALVVAPSASGRKLVNGAAIGGVAAVGIPFQALGAVRLPLAGRYLIRRPIRETAAALATFSAVALGLVWPFSGAFIDLIANRAYAGSTSAPGHASPWTLLPSFMPLQYLRPAITLAAVCICLIAYCKGKIDLLNCLAGCLVAVVCIWITTGSMDRMNIAMIFALVCLATVSSKLWPRLIFANAVAQALIYPAGIVLNHATAETLEACDAWATALFLVLYFGSILVLAPAGHKRTVLV